MKQNELKHWISVWSEIYISFSKSHNFLDFQFSIIVNAVKKKHTKTDFFQKY